MLSLDRHRNDTSIALDLTRVIAAQMVCFGHAVNLADAGPQNTIMPEVGVLLFFILSGFVIAHTLTTKSSDPGYGLVVYGIERTSRIYCAYLPAMLLFAAIEYSTSWLGIRNAPNIGLNTFLANLAMLQGYPMNNAFSTFGVSGQTTSIAIEFHIYFFVGALYFFFTGRQRLPALIVAILAAPMPLVQFLALNGRGLFILWLFGFSIYFVLRSVDIDRTLAVGLCIIAAASVFALRGYIDTKDAYNIVNFPVLALAFAALVAVTQGTKALANLPGIVRFIHFLADYSLTLFLIHFIVMKTILISWPQARWPGALVCWTASNIIAAFLAQATEVHYRMVSAWILRRVPGFISAEYSSTAGRGSFRTD